MMVDLKTPFQQRFRHLAEELKTQMIPGSKQDISKPIEDSRQSAAIRLQIHVDCIHAACCLSCLIIMDEHYHTRIMEMRELDEGVQGSI